tara:strand:+ start:233 stop:526 length:294 start_codon:yes stop_codon:yes gene_type:complete
MTQLGLFDTSRGRKNSESQAAHKRLMKGNRKQLQLNQVFGYVERAEQYGVTCRETAELMETGMNVISGRFTELKASGRIEKIGVRNGCAVYIAKEAR